jgi:hypothetical protein
MLDKLQKWLDVNFIEPNKIKTSLIENIVIWYGFVGLAIWNLALSDDLIMTYMGRSQGAKCLKILVTLIKRVNW